MIIKLDIKCFLFNEEGEVECRRRVEIDDNSTLEDLHFVIQQAVNFANDHLYEFFIANSPRSLKRVRFDDENELIYELKLADVFPLEKGKKLFYLFDYGDSWLFQIAKARTKPSEPVTGVSYPRLIERIGPDPEQYPDYDVDWDYV